MRGQLLLAYFYAGVAKLSADWILDAAPMRWVLADPAILYTGDAALSIKN